jgi:ABC-type cobalt transport system substrate-binding protein
MVVMMVMIINSNDDGDYDGSDDGSDGDNDGVM